MSTVSSSDNAQRPMTGTSVPSLPSRKQLLMPSGPAFPEFVYRFIDKLFHLDRV